jgi:hypothetical protein
LLVFLDFCVVFLMGTVLLVFLDFCVVLLVGPVLLVFLDFCVVFFVLFVFVLCLVYIVVSFSGLSILDCPSVFSYVYFLTLKTYHYNTISSILFYSLQDFILSLIFQIYFFSINYLPFFADLFTYININIRLTWLVGKWCQHLLTL